MDPSRVCYGCLSKVKITKFRKTITLRRSTTRRLVKVLNIPGVYFSLVQLGVDLYELNIYGPRVESEYVANAIGDSRSGYLQTPHTVQAGIQYDNPQYLQNPYNPIDLHKKVKFVGTEICTWSGSQIQRMSRRTKRTRRLYPAARGALLRDHIKMDLFKFPTEIMRHIGSFFSFASRSNFLRTNKLAYNATDPGDLERVYVWDRIFKDYSWLSEMLKRDMQPALVGTHLRRMDKPPKKSKHNLLALVLSGQNAPLHEDDLEHLLHSLRSKRVDREIFQVEFSALTLDIGHPFGRTKSVCPLALTGKQLDNGTMPSALLYFDVPAVQIQSTSARPVDPDTLRIEDIRRGDSWVFMDED